MKISRQKIFMIASMAMLISSIFLLMTGCDKGGGSASNPVAPTGSGGVTGALYHDRNVQLASTSKDESIWLALFREAEALVSISVAHAVVDTSNSSPSSGILVELLMNGTVVASTTTGPNGKFEFGGLAAGEYILRFTKEPDLLITTTVNIKEGAITEIEGKITLASSGNVHLMMEIEKRRTVDHYFVHEKKDSEKQKNKESKKDKKKKDDLDDDDDKKKVS